jgi:glycosyltransferase involved in cell wall biosynthesis
MRILLAHQNSPFRDGEGGGSAVYVAGLARALAAASHDVAVLYRIDATETNVPGGGAIVEASLGEGTGRVIRLFGVADRSAPRSDDYRSVAIANTADSVLATLAPDVVHVHHLNRLSTGIVFKARARGIPVVLTLHDYWLACPLGQLLDWRLRVCPGPTPGGCAGCAGVLSRPSMPTVFRSIAARAAASHRVARSRASIRLEEMKHVASTVDLLISPSESLARRFANLGFPVARVLPNGIDEAWPEVGPPLPVAPQTLRDGAEDRPVVFGFIGSVIPSKGPQILVDAFRRLAHPRARLRIHGPALSYHGDFGHVARLERAIREAGLDPATTLRGSFPHRDIASVLSGLDALVVPSIWEENAPLTIQEAFLAGKPVLGSAHGGIAEMVRDGVDGLLFQPGDALDLARVMRAFVDDPRLRERLGRNPRGSAIWAEHVADLEEAYADARSRFVARIGRPGVVVLDAGRPELAAVATRSAIQTGVRAPVFVVRNGPPCPPVDNRSRGFGRDESNLPQGVEVHTLDQNLGYAGGMNAGIEILRGRGCDRFLLLNSDARLESGALRLLAEQLEPADAAAATPVVLRPDGRVEHRGGEFKALWGRARLMDFGEPPKPDARVIDVDAIPGAVWMIHERAWSAAGPLDPSFFFGVEDFEWSLRARALGLRLTCVTSASATHLGSATIGAASPDRLYYAARNHLALARRLGATAALGLGLRLPSVAILALAYAVKQRHTPTVAAIAATLAGFRDFWRGRTGTRPS